MKFQVICDYTTRYPEAVPMRHIDAASVAVELLKLILRVGVPKEILTRYLTLLHVQLIQAHPVIHRQTVWWNVLIGP